MFTLRLTLNSSEFTSIVTLNSSELTCTLTLNSSELTFFIFYILINNYMYNKSNSELFRVNRHANIELLRVPQHVNYELFRVTFLYSQFNHNSITNHRLPKTPQTYSERSGSTPQKMH